MSTMSPARSDVSRGNCLNIIQWNCHSITNKKHILEYFINTYKIDVFCISETCLKENHNFSISGYKTVSRERDNGRSWGGIALIINARLKFESQDDKHSNFLRRCRDNHVETQIVKVFNNEDFITFVNIYSPPRGTETHHTDDDFWISFFDYIENLENVILLGDFNAISTTWAINSSDNKEGKKLEVALDSSRFVIANNGEHTWSSLDETRKSTLDLTFIDPTLVPVCSWEVMNYKFSSDHLPIKISLFNQKPKIQKCRPKILIKSVDWQIFQDQCVNKTSNLEIKDNDTYDLLIKNITDSIIEAGGKIIKEYKLDNKSRPTWWNDKCQKIIENDKQNYANFKTDQTLESLNKYQNCRKNGKKKIEKVWKDSFHGFCNSLSINSDSGVVWKKINAVKNKKLQSDIPILSNRVDRDNLVRAFDKIAPVNVEVIDKSRFLKSHQPNKSKNTDIFDRQLTMEEYLCALNSFKSKSAPGPDLLNFVVLRKLPKSIHQKILNYFQLILDTGEIPDSWTEFFVIFIPKQNKKDVRPISLANCLMKFFEKIIQRKVEYWAETNDVIPAEQSGFRKARSCIDTVATFVTTTQNNLINKQITGALFLDIEGAYDNVDPFLLYREFWLRGLPCKISKVLYNLIKVRKVHAYNEGEFIGTRLTTKGVPQGSVLSPTSFNLYVASLKSCLPDGVSFLQYADDIVLYAKGKDLSQVSSLLNQALEDVAGFLDRLCLRVSGPKTKLVIFARTDKSLDYQFLNNKVKLYGNPIQLEPSIKYLGFFLKYNLSWDLHVSHICKSAKKMINVIKAVAGIKWGGHPQTLLNIYKGLVRPRLDWGSQIFNVTSKKNLKKLDVIQFAALRTSLGLMRTTPTNILLDMAGEPPLCARRKYLSQKFILKTFSFTSSPLRSEITTLCDNIGYYDSRSIKSNLVETRIEMNDMIDELIILDRPSIFNFAYQNRFVDIKDHINCTAGYKIAEMDRNFMLKKKKSRIIDKNFDKYIQDNNPNHTLIYTDGSKDPNTDRVGFAVWCPREEYRLKVKINPTYSIFQAEAFAIDRALNLILDKNLERSLIVSDSQSVLVALSNDDKKGNQDMCIYNIKQLYSRAVTNGCIVDFLWVPSHCGITGNETVDKLATEALVLESVDIKDFYYYNADGKLRESLKIDSVEFIKKESDSKGVKYFSLKDQILNKPWFKSANKDRDIICFISRLRTGHTCCSSHLTNKNIKTDRTCECGFPNQDLNHMFFECSLHYEQSSKLLSDILNINPLVSRDVVSLAFSSNWKIYRLLFSFVVQNKLII